jgi:hypothetical protein
MTVYDQMLTWVIPERLIAAGLEKPPAASAAAATSPPLPRNGAKAGR